MNHYPTAFSIAGSDCSGGAGLQADLKTFSALGVYGAAAVTAITVQDTRGVRRVEPLSPELVQAQVEVVLDDLEPQAVKVGMAGSVGALQAIGSAFERHRPPFVVADPVVCSSSGATLLPDAAIDYLLAHFLPHVSLLTPNLPEAERLSSVAISSETTLRTAAARLLSAGCGAVLIKGGHAAGPARRDVLFVRTAGGHLEQTAWEAPAVDTPNTHGTGCTLSSAIAAYVAHGKGLTEAIGCAKTYVSRALEAAADVTVGHGTGPLNHFFDPQPLIKRPS